MYGSEARAVVESAIRREIFGPIPGDKPLGSPINCSDGSIHFESKEASRGQFYEATSFEEILSQTDPLRRYGIGVLYSGEAIRGSSIISDNKASEAPENFDISWVQGIAQSEENPNEVPVQVSGVLKHDQADSDDFELTDANSFKPSAMAISFKCRVLTGGSLSIKLSGASYEKITAHIPEVNQPQDWWLRKPFEIIASVHAQALLVENNRLKNVDVTSSVQSTHANPTIQIYSRPVPGDSDKELRLVTVAVVNNTVGSGPGSALFQMGFTVTTMEGIVIEPYPKVERVDDDEELQSIELLYRNKLTYAIGHGCAAEWSAAENMTTPWVRAEPLPAYEIVSLTPDVYVTNSAGNRERVTVSMEELSKGSKVGREQVGTVLRLYGEWITQQENLIPDLLPRFQHAARRHIKLCRQALERMHEGWKLVQSSRIAKIAFSLANEAMLFQQIRSRLPLRDVESGADKVIRPVGEHPKATPQPGQGYWRPFQIAFLLASLPELVEPKRPTRSLVDLIFFPTGGGKTEAYLGASAISLIARRLRDPNDGGTDTIMRYTLRLLTAQQFLRAASLVCVLENIRSTRVDELGKSPFGIGIWVGGSSTPNNWKQAVKVLTDLRRNPQTENLLLLLRCPWCGTKMGPKPRQHGGQDVIGYEQVGSSKVIFRCIDPQCFYSSRKGMPVHVVDDDIYEVRPSIVIGTVDKFAMMAWRPQVRRLFGLGDNGSREVSPPSLIIQDELHLISGPLGSMVGLYEPVIDELCTDKRTSEPVPPKIIASTATTRQYGDQIRGLYGRTEVAIFPPHGLEDGHSFFAEPAIDTDGMPEPGRRYLGIMSASFGSMQTVQVRVGAAALQATNQIPESNRDGYWTNLNFFNSLRELGNTVSLLQSDVPDYVTALRLRDGIKPRWPHKIMELTSRRRNDEIPKAIEQLQMSYGKQGCVDICLATNIIEVGVDIDRLGLMTIVGQPKTTAQYIQVSGRVGRRADVSPGLILTIYSPSKPRDRSHYERFRTYHQQLYSQVEPTSVTPFAMPVLRRALHAAAIAYIRQTSPSLDPHPFPRAEYNAAISLLRDRAAKVDPDELEEFDRIADQRAHEWSKWERTTWEANVIGGDPKQGLMRTAGTLPDPDGKAIIWDVPTSVRNVDAECRIQISTAYAQADAEDGSQ